MHLQSPKEVHLRLELSGKQSWVPLRYLIQPPSKKTGVRGGTRQHQSKPVAKKTTFDIAANQVATTFHDNTEQHERSRQLLQIFSFYSDFKNGIRTHNCIHFAKMLNHCQLSKFAEYRSSDELMCWKSFAKIKQHVDPMTVDLNFEQFCDGFVHIVPYVFRTSSTNPTVLCKLLVDQHIITRAHRVRSDPLTLALLWNEKAQLVIEKYKWQLQVIFNHFASLYEDALDSGTPEVGALGVGDPVAAANVATHTRTELQAWMKTPNVDASIDVKEFLMLLQCFDIVGSSPAHITVERARQMFDEANLSELADADVDRLCFHEYTEALGRCALDMYPLEDGSQSKALNITSSRVNFGQSARLTNSVKSAVEFIFARGSGSDADSMAVPVQPSKDLNRIYRQLSPRARRFHAKGWGKKKKQQPIGTVSWGRDTFIQNSSSLKSV